MKKQKSEAPTLFEGNAEVPGASPVGPVGPAISRSLVVGLKAEDSAQGTTGVLRVTEETLVNGFNHYLQHEISNGDATEDTVATYQREVGLWLQWCVEHGVEPARVTRAHIVRYRDMLKGRGSAVSTRKVKVSIVRRFYDAAVQYGYLRENPADGVFGGTDFTPPEERIVTLTTGALEALFVAIPRETLNGKRDRAILALMTLHGLRRIEIHRLDEKDLVEQGGEAFIDVRGKGHRGRQVHLRADSQAAIRAYLDAKGQAGLPRDAMFVSHDNRARGQRISRRGLNMITDRYLEDSDLKRGGFSCRALRNTHGTLAVAGGASLENLRREMGHGDIASTEVYARAVERRRNNPSNFIDVEI